MTHLKMAWLAATIALSTPLAASAQLSLDSDPSRGAASDFLQRQRDLERENQRKVHEQLPATQKFRMDYGGWYNAYFFLFDDGVESSRTLRQNELRLWASFSADRGIHNGYARVRMTYNDWNAGDSFSGNEDDLDGPNLERGWYSFDVGRAIDAYGNNDAPFGLTFKLGRDLVTIGTGYAIDLPLDHVQVQAELFDFQTTYIAGRTPASTENIDRSRPVADHSDRVFHIIEQRYKGWAEHEPFFYIAWQDDHTTEDPPSLYQQYRYDSRYIGFGASGELVDNLRYHTEWVIERGRSYNDQRFMQRSKIKSWGFDHRLDYFFTHKTKPVVSAEWMFASGDPNRLFTPTNAAGGNAGDHVDNSFVGFGFRDTGIAFSPRLSNMHVWRAGASFRPLPEVEAAKSLEVGSDCYLYYKNRSKAAVSDGLADRQSGYLGWEVDCFANYRIVSDLAWTVRFGSFFPGKAFSDRTTRTFLLTGVTWSF